MNDPSPRLGPFALDAPIGAGGMAVVWRGEHVPTATPVAVKLIVSHEDRRATHRRALENEVRAMARLDHPGIVSVLDVGEVPREAAAPERGLHPGTPYLVMELATAGPLTKRGARSYERLRSVLRGLLRALAHAHSRGVIHRDLKPSNVLFDDDRGPPRLTDFGIAHAIERASAPASRAPLSAGTAWFMAPEQILGLHRDEGPATDLYALGCLAYLVCCGRPPYASKARDAVYRAHCLAEAPPLEPTFRVPSELEAWVHILLSKQPTERFATAADAAAALDQVGGPWIEPNDAVPDAPPELGSEESTYAEAGPTRLELVQRFVTAPTPRRGGGSRLRRIRAIVPREPPPPSPPTSARLLGVGLGLHGLRAIPFAGRRAERERLWRLLAEVDADGRPRAVVIRGRAGLGKTRLTEWLSELAAERGAASVWWTVHDDRPAPFDGPSRLLRRHMRLDGLDRAAIDARLDERLGSLDEATRRRLATWLAPRLDAGPGMPVEERHAIATELLVDRTRDRPALLVLEDVQHGPESIAFAERLLKTPVRALVVLTAREEALEANPERAAMLDALAKRPGVAELNLEPLSKRSHGELVESLLGLGPDLAKTVAARTLGSPLFAVQLVGDWVQRGVLVPTADGFVLAGEAPPIPDDIHALWSERVAGLERSYPEARREHVAHALSVMALLGRAALRDEWERACEELGLTVEPTLLERMASRRLARVGRQRYSLVHGMLHESLVRRVEERGEQTEVHAACARALAALYADDDLHAERVARHLEEAGDRVHAARYLERAARARILSCDFGDARRLAGQLDALLDDEGVPADDRSRLAPVLVHAEVTGIQALLEENERLLHRAESLALAFDPARLSTVRWLQGGLALKRGALEPALARFEAGAQISREHGETKMNAQCRHGMAEASKLLGEVDRAVGWYEEAAARFTELGDALGFGRSRMGIADAYRRRGELAKSAEVLEEAVYWMRRWGNRHSAAVGINSLGDVARTRGQLEEAREHYREALRMFDSLGSEEAVLVRANLGLVLLATGESAAARTVFRDARPAMEHGRRRGFLSFVVAGLMLAEAGLGAWERVDALGDELDALLEESGLLDDDLGWCLDQTAKLAREAGHPDRERRALERALVQWRGVERLSEASEVSARLAGLISAGS